MHHIYQKYLIWANLPDDTGLTCIKCHIIDTTPTYKYITVIVFCCHNNIIRNFCSSLSFLLKYFYTTYFEYSSIILLVSLNALLSKIFIRQWYKTAAKNQILNKTNAYEWRTYTWSSWRKKNGTSKVLTARKDKRGTDSIAQPDKS